MPNEMIGKQERVDVVNVHINLKNEIENLPEVNFFGESNLVAIAEGKLQCELLEDVLELETDEETETFLKGKLEEFDGRDEFECTQQVYDLFFGNYSELSDYF